MESRQHIVIVDDNPVNLDMEAVVLKDEYKVTKLISGGQLFKLLARVHPDMILLDIQMPGMDGYEVLRELRKHPEWEDIPVIFVTGQKDSSSEQEGFRLGAQDFIGKPFDNEITLSRIQAQLELYRYRHGLEDIIREKTRSIEKLQQVITTSWAEVVESRDGTTGSHVRNTARYYDLLLQAMQDAPEYAGALSAGQRQECVRASIMHDIGKIGISDEVLKKPGPLTMEEFEQMKLHSRIGADLIRKIIDQTDMHGFLQTAENLALSHHERWDGSGYPNGLSGNRIPLYVRALSIADVYDALTSVRPYKPAFSHEEAVETMKREQGTFFDPALFDFFLRSQELFHQALLKRED